MPDVKALVFVVDDDASLRASLQDLLGSVGLRVIAFASAQEFLRSPRPEVPSCLVLDVRLPGMDGLAFQRQLAAMHWRIPIIFVTAYTDDTVRARALAAGAVAVLSKPYREEDLLHAIEAALTPS